MNKYEMGYDPGTEIGKEKENKLVELTEGQETETIIRAPGIIETTAMGPCIGIFAYRRSDKGGMAKHFVNPGIMPTLPMMPKFLDKVLKRYGDSKGVKTWVGGGSPSARDFDNIHAYEELKQVRTSVVNALKERGFKNPEIKWLDSSNENMVMRLNLVTGKMDFDIEEN